MVDEEGAMTPAFVLASGSPRRRELLSACGADVVVRPVGVDETPRVGEDALDLARRLARAKAVAGAAAEGPGWALGSDTVVVLDGEVLGKPADGGEAAATLRRLSGRRHEVITAWAVASRGGEVRVGHEVAGVRFRALSEAEIAAYVATGDPLDKAGAYGIQGGAGRFVEALEGEFDVVVGLPVGPVLDALVECGALPPYPSAIARRLAVVRGRIEAAARAAGRSAADVTLVAVSKTQPAEAVRAAMAAGQRAFGENYVQEWRAKADAIGPGPEWHFIGHLQRNKAKLVAQDVALVHGIDQVRTAEALGRAATGEVPILVEVNVGGEASKSGVAPAELPALLDSLDAISGVRVRGLMAIPPPAGPGEARRAFERLRALRDAHATAGRPLPLLSMGMSGDYEGAIAEGATHVRVGTAIFGARSHG
jgi:MAF protein